MANALNHQGWGSRLDGRQEKEKGYSPGQVFLEAKGIFSQVLFSLPSWYELLRGTCTSNFILQIKISVTWFDQTSGLVMYLCDKPEKYINIKLHCS